MTTPQALQRQVAMGFPEAVQAIAALDARIIHLRVIGAEPWAIADCHAAVAAVRETFDIWPGRPAKSDEALWAESELRAAWGDR